MPGSKNKIAKYNYEKFFELSMDLTCILGTDGYVKKINRHFLQVFQYKEVEVLNQSFLKFVAEEDFQATSVFWKRLINGEPLVNFKITASAKTEAKDFWNGPRF